MTARTIASRAQVGSAAQVHQRQPLLTRSITIDDPTIIVIRHGSKIMRWAGNEIELAAGDVVIIGAGQSFDVMNIPCPQHGAFAAAWLSFCPQLVEGFSGNHPASRSVSEAIRLAQPSDSFRKAFYHTIDALSEPAQVPQSIARQRMQEMLSWLDEYGVCFAGRQQKSMARRIRQMVASAPSQAWSLKQVAEHCGLSEATLRRRLSAEQTSFSRLVADVRMCRALTLLQVTDLSITHIACDVGYDNASKFAARFRQRFGFAPGQVRSADSPDGASAPTATRLFV